MHRNILFALASFTSVTVQAQSYYDSIAQFRKHYKEEFITEERSPLKAADTGYLEFFKIDKRYRVVATFKATPDAQAFDMPTHSGKTKKFRQYGLIKFKLHDTSLALQIFQNLSLKDPKYKDDLFLPFTDLTSYNETYGGGRYIDLSINDIKKGKLILDFNKCYNPYCAYAEGYNCPIPPVENRLPVAIKAGEKMWPKH
jgi:uncharacterized protein (DUF1684 family)